jgi:hypothetical protein
MKLADLLNSLTDEERDFIAGSTTGETSHFTVRPWIWSWQTVVAWTWRSSTGSRWNATLVAAFSCDQNLASHNVFHGNVTA